MHRPLPPLDVLREKLEYSAHDGVFHNRRTGKVAGYTRNDGYRGIRIAGREWLGQRLAYYMTHEVDPGDLFVDHINGKRGDNSADNLQLVTNQQNQHKSKVCNNNPQTINGVLTPYGREVHRRKNRNQTGRQLKTVGETNHGHHVARSEPSDAAAHL